MPRMKGTGGKGHIKAWLLKGNSITRVMCAEKRWGMDLTTRISELKSEGMKISDKFIDGSKRQKSYFMTHAQIMAYNQSNSE